MQVRGRAGGFEVVEALVGQVLDAVAPLYRTLREKAPLVRVTTPAGDPAWLVLATR